MAGDTPHPCTLEYWVDYCTDEGDWIEGLHVNMTTLGGYWISGTERHGGFRVKWYNRGELIKQQDMFFYVRGKADNVSYVRLWIDLWLNKENASSVISGRLNAYYYPMKDSSNAWLRWLTEAIGVSTKKKRNKQCFSLL